MSVKECNAVKKTEFWMRIEDESLEFTEWKKDRKKVLDWMNSNKEKILLEYEEKPKWGDRIIITKVNNTEVEFVEYYDGEVMWSNGVFV